jgi:hypothetical protein
MNLFNETMQSFMLVKAIDKIFNDDPEATITLDAQTWGAMRKSSVKIVEGLPIPFETNIKEDM